MFATLDTIPAPSDGTVGADAWCQLFYGYGMSSPARCPFHALVRLTRSSTVALALEDGASIDTFRDHVELLRQHIEAVREAVKSKERAVGFGGKIESRGSRELTAKGKVKR